MISLPQRPSDAKVQQQDLVRVVEQLGEGAEARLITGVEVGTSETGIQHGQRSVPKAVLVCPRGAVAAGRGPTPPDATFIYLIAASACTVDVLVFL